MEPVKNKKWWYYISPNPTRAEYRFVYTEMVNHPNEDGLGPWGPFDLFDQAKAQLDAVTRSYINDILSAYNKLHAETESDWLMNFELGDLQ